MKLFSIIFFTLILAISCSEKKEEIPTDIIPKEKFISLLVDMYLLEGKFSHAELIDKSTYENGIQEYTELFKKYDADKNKVNKSFDYYTAHPELMKEIYTAALDSLNLKSNRK